ncbi:MAG: acyl-CoA dehydrogenase family protein [Longimicrobiales bacterium]
MLSSEQIAIQALAREFADGEIRPHSAAWDGAGAFDDSVLAKLAELGFLGMLTPEEYGGLGLDVTTYLTVLEQLAWGDAAVALTVAIQNGPIPHLLLTHGSEEQRRSWLPLLASGERVGAFALSEPGAGSDPGSLSTTAVPKGDGWVLKGEKRWVTNGGRADMCLVFARTGDPNDGKPAIGCFIVDTSSAGYEVGRREKTMGLKASETVSVSLKEVEVGPEALVGDPARALGYALDALNIGRLGIAAQSVGIAQAALEHATRYAVEREQFGRSIAEFGAIRSKLANMATKTCAARALMMDVGARVGADGNGGASLPPYKAQVAMAKLHATEAATWVADEAVQIYGGYGYMRHYPVEKLMRDAKGPEIYEGTSEVLRMVVGGSLTSEFQA